MADRIRVEVTPATAQVDAGGRPQEVTVTVYNAGPVVDQYTLELEGLPPDWVTLPVATAALFPQERAALAFRLHPPRRPDVRAGEYPYAVRLRSRAEPAQETTVACRLIVGGYGRFRLDMSPQRVTGRSGRYTVMLVNTGNRELPIALDARDPELACQFTFTTPRPVVPPGAPLNVLLTVRPNQRPFVGEPKPYDFTLTAQPPGEGEQPRRLTGQLVYKPRFRSWKPFLLVPLFLVLLAAGITLAVSEEARTQARRPVEWGRCKALPDECLTPTPAPAPTGTSERDSHHLA